MPALDLPAAASSSLPTTPRAVHVLDSHTAGEPTRVVLTGGPNLGTGTLADRLACFRSKHDAFRSAIVCEPRGWQAMVGALLCEPLDRANATGVIFFNETGYLGMCGHGTIGVVATLASLGWLAPGRHGIETPVGVVYATLHPDRRVTLENVPAFRYATAVRVQVPAGAWGAAHLLEGEIAWGGNWFFLAEQAIFPLLVSAATALTAYALAVRAAVTTAGCTGAAGEPIEHVEFHGPAMDPANSARNFVLCPGTAYDRSPCGTGTSARLACLAEDGALAPGELWRQEGILGTVFIASYAHLEARPAQPEPGQPDPARPGPAYSGPAYSGRASGRAQSAVILPRITGAAYITADTQLFFDARDPFAAGIRP